ACARHAPVQRGRQTSAADIFWRKPRNSRNQSKCVASRTKIEKHPKLRERKIDIAIFLRRRGRSRFGRCEINFSPAYGWPLWNFSRRTLLPRLRRAPGLRICRSTAADRARRLDRPTSFWRLASGFAFFPRARRRRNRLACREIGSRNGRRSFCTSPGRSRSNLRADLSRDASLAHDECFRAAGLDG